MLTEERYSKILSHLFAQKSVSVDDLVGLLDVSESTVRRDLNALHAMGKLTKVFGGAMVLDAPSKLDIDRDINEKRTLHHEGKEFIARRAALLINDDDFVFVDAGSTTELLCELMPSTQATFVARALVHALHLLRKGLKVSVLGGPLASNTEAVVGAEALEKLQHYNFTKAFLGVNGIDSERGLSVPDEEEAAIKQAALKRSFASYVLADSSKFDKIVAVSFAGFDAVCLITDHEPPSKYNEIVPIQVAGKLNGGL